MAIEQGNTLHVVSSNPHLRQLHLFSLISQLCAPRRDRPDSDNCRLIVDSRLAWAVEPIDGGSSWLYVPEGARVRKVADCLVLTPFES